MGALNSLPHALRGLVRNPILLVVTGLYAAIQLPQLVLQAADPLLATLVSIGMWGVLVLIVPFYQGGVISMANDALEGSVGVRSFVDGGKSNYLSLLGAYLLLFALSFAFGMAISIGFIVLAAFVLSSGGGTGPLGWAILGGVGLLVVLAYLVVAYFVQFYAHAIVLDDQRLVDGFRRSVGLVRENLVSVLGYSVVAGAGGVLLGAIGWGATMVFSPQQQLDALPFPLPEPTVPVLAAAAILYLIAVGVGGAFWATYSVSYYRDISPTPAA